MSTLRDAHVSHNSIPGPQGVQSSGETAPVMGRSLITTRASPLNNFSNMDGGRKTCLGRLVHL